MVETRRIDNDHTVPWRGVKWQIPREAIRPGMRGSRGSRRTATGRIDGGQRSGQVYFVRVLSGRVCGQTEDQAHTASQPAIQTGAGPKPMDGPVPGERQRSVARLSGGTLSNAVSTWSSELTFFLSRLACGSQEFDPPFPFPPGASRGGDGSPHAPASTVVNRVAPSKKPELSIWLKTGTFYLALTEILARAARTRG